MVPACKDDMLRSAWMFAVGACDAFFADAYADLISRTLRAKELEPSIALPNRLNNLQVPVAVMLRSTSMPGWKWRMAARELVEKENVLSFDQIRELFHQFFPKRQGLLSQDRVFSWMQSALYKRRHFDITHAQFLALSPTDQSKAKEKSLEHFEARFTSIFQRRHDCIHCCDRPKNAVQSIKEPTVDKRIADIEFLVSNCHAELTRRFPEYLRDLGFSAATKNQVMT